MGSVALAAQSLQLLLNSLLHRRLSSRGIRNSPRLFAFLFLWVAALTATLESVGSPFFGPGSRRPRESSPIQHFRIFSSGWWRKVGRSKASALSFSGDGPPSVGEHLHPTCRRRRLGNFGRRGPSFFGVSLLVHRSLQKGHASPFLRNSSSLRLQYRPFRWETECFNVSG